MEEFFILLENLKSLYDSGLYEDVKILADLLLGMYESSASFGGLFDLRYIPSSSVSSPSPSAPCSSNSTTTPIISAPRLTVSGATTSNSNEFVFDPKDKYMIYNLYGNAAFNLREYKLAESLFNKALKINKSNLRPKPKTLTSLVK